MSDEETRYEAVRSRDARFDGVFFFAVSTTGIYCRPSCPAVTPKRRNVRFYPTAAAAQHSGFRACRRCRPDAAPGSAEWDLRADAVGRAMRMISDGVVDREGVSGLATRLGYSTRQVQRQLTAELGAGPVALARAQRAHTARVLLQTTDLPVTEIAFAAGFASVRQFNETIRAVYDTTPTGLRGTPASAPRRVRTTTAAGKSPGPRAGYGPRAAYDTRPTPDPRTPTDTPARYQAGIPLRLAHRGPYQSDAVFDLLARECLPGVEEVTGPDGDRTYRRTLRLPHGSGIAAVTESGGRAAGQDGDRSGGRAVGKGDGRDSDRPGRDGRPTSPVHPGGWLAARLYLTDLRDLTTAVHRLRRLFDLDADPFAVDERLGADEELAPLVAARPGLRVPGAADPEEFALRAVAGPAESARLLERYGTALDRTCGSLTHLFPAPGDLCQVRGPVGELARALASGGLRLDAGADREQAALALGALPGLDPHTATAIRTRALADPDAPAPGEELPAAWRPWRAYARQHLYTEREFTP